MGLDIRFIQRKKNVCPHCGKITGHTDVVDTYSGGRVWYDFLESIGYYVPYEKRTEENDWYGKDMVLTAEQVNAAYIFVMNYEPYNWNVIRGMIAVAMAEHDDIVVNADW